MTEIMENIIQNGFGRQEFTSLIERHIEKSKLPDKKQKKLFDTLSHLCFSFTNTFNPYFEYSTNTRYDRIILNMEEFLKRLRLTNIKLKQHNDKEVAASFHTFWKTINKEVGDSARYMEDQYLINCTNAFSYQMEQIFKN